MCTACKTLIYFLFFVLGGEDGVPHRVSDRRPTGRDLSVSVLHGAGSNSATVLNSNGYKSINALIVVIQTYSAIAANPWPRLRHMTPSWYRLEIISRLIVTVILWRSLEECAGLPSAV